MNWDIIEGKWKQVSGAVKTKWAKLTDDDLAAVGGKRDHLAGKLQEVYGKAKDIVEREITEFERDFLDGRPSSEPRENRRGSKTTGGKV